MSRPTAFLLWADIPAGREAEFNEWYSREHAPDRLVEGVRTVAAGEALLAPSLTRRLIEEHVKRPAPARGVPEALSALTERELEVFDLVANGLSNGEIAERLLVSLATVKTHVNRVITKLDGRSRPQLVVLGYESGRICPGVPEGR